jgi:hypothetical protein
MKESSHSISWGGYRPGAGQKPKWRNGTTATIRIPQLLIEDVMRYAQLVDGQSPHGLKAEDCLSCTLDSDTQSSKSELVSNERDRLDSECNELAERVGDLHLQLEEAKQGFEIVTESSYLQGMEILREAIGLKPNAGGAIKKEIKRALELLSLGTPTE